MKFGVTYKIRQKMPHPQTCLKIMLQCFLTKMECMQACMKLAEENKDLTCIIFVLSGVLNKYASTMEDSADFKQGNIVKLEKICADMAEGRLKEDM